MLGLLVGCLLQANAQEPVPTVSPSSSIPAASSQLSGRVRGPEGEAIPGVQVSALNLKTGQRVQTATDSDGRYRLTNLPAGEYQVKVEAKGFRVQVAERVPVPASGGRTLDFQFPGGPVPTSEPISPVERSFQVLEWSAAGETELRQLLESMAVAGWALAGVVPIGPKRGFFYLEKAAGARYELVPRNEPLKADDLRRQIEERTAGRLMGAHRLTASKLVLIFRFAP